MTVTTILRATKVRKSDLGMYATMFFSVLIDDSDASPDEDDEESHGKSEGSESASEEEEVKEEDVHSEEASTNKDESSNHGTEVIAVNISLSHVDGVTDSLNLFFMT